MTRKIEKAGKGKKKSKKKNLKPERRNTTKKANSYTELKKALKRINLKRIIINAPDE